MTRDSQRDDDFMERRDHARGRLDEISGAKGGDPSDRRAWFSQVYRTAGDDPAAVPWADLAPKEKLVEWLAVHRGEGRRAIDIACGLGDNAEALAAAGWRTTAFDFAPDAISWARRRFAESDVDYRVADLFDLPPDWRGAFDLVHECYTLQALDGALRDAAFEAVATLVKPGGLLVVIARTRPEGSEAEGPPWPLMPSELDRFADLGFEEEERLDYEVERPNGRVIAHARAVYRRK